MKFKVQAASYCHDTRFIIGLLLGISLADAGKNQPHRFIWISDCKLYTNLCQRQLEERAAIDGRIIDYTLHPIWTRIHSNVHACDVKMWPKFLAVYCFPVVWFTDTERRIPFYTWSIDTVNNGLTQGSGIGLYPQQWTWDPLLAL